MWFSIFLGQKLKPLYLWNNLSHRICLYIVGKHLPSSKRWLINEMDVSVPDREISVLNIDKIPEKSGKSEFFVGGPKISIFENWLIFYIRIKKMSNLVKFHQNICIFEDFTAIYFLCVFYKDLTWNWKFFSDHVTKKIHKKNFRHCINLKFCQKMPN